MEVKLESLLTVTIKEEEIGKLISELNFLAQVHDFEIETLLAIRDELHTKYYKEGN